MKKYLDHVPVVFVVSSFIFLLLHLEKSNAAIAFIASVLLFAYQQWLFKQESPDYSANIKEVESNLNILLEIVENNKKDADHKLESELLKIKDDIGKMSMSLAKVPGVVPTKPKDKVYF